ncbi:MAG: ornithine carbamoyltransferase [Polyangiaceae bacterium]|nr:ornithine carbamoyltransferase [Polyangiaceae bacterium]
MPKHLLRVSDLSAAELIALIDAADAFKAEPNRAATRLRGSSVTMYFSKPSTRTRLSFQTAVHRLGGLPIITGPNELQMGRGETIEDTARIVSRMSAAFVIRTFADADVEAFAKAASIPVINALTDGHHPCQALADLMTLRARFGKLEGLTLAYVGAGNNVAHSLLEACALAKMNVRIAAPASLPPAEDIVSKAKELAKSGGTEVVVTSDARAAVAGADCVYADTWLSMGDPPEERDERLRVLQPYQIDAALMACAKPSAVFMHCLPAHRGEEVTADVADSDRSIIFDQAENRLHTSLAVLDALVRDVAV